MKKTVVMGFLGSQLDNGRGARRWAKWRPTVSLVQHAESPVSRVELFYSPQHLSLAQHVRADIIQVAPDTAVNLVEMNIKDPWDFGEVYACLYDWVRSYPFDTTREQYRAHITTGTHVAQICMFLLVESKRIPGLLLQTSPPAKQRVGHAGRSTLIDLDLSRYDAIAQRFQREHSDAIAFLKAGIQTRNAHFNALVDEIERVAVRSRAPVLLTGPTGAGKSHLARRVFDLKKARHQVKGEFVEINCATLHGDTTASTLFGHKKGAFTGAAADRPGLLRTAHEGVLFLDEIGELGLDEQAMLLKAIEEKRFLPVGSDREVQSDFQLIAGTHRDLRGEVSAGRFREDLFARINLWSYTLPGLAQRPEDIEPNIEHLLAQAAAEVGHVVRFQVEAKKHYLRFARSPEALWTGNFRDLAGSITRLATLADNGRITAALVDAECARLRWLWQRTTRRATSTAADEVVDLSRWLDETTLQTLDLFDQLQLQAVLNACQQSRSLSEAGRRLFNISRTQRSVINDADRLRKYLARFGLTWDSLAI